MIKFNLWQKWRQQRQDNRPYVSNKSQTATIPQVNIISSTKMGQKPVFPSNRPSRGRKLHSPLMFVLAVASLTSVVGDRFYNQPQLAVDTISPEKIIAPNDGRFDDDETTEEMRKEARNGVVPILMVDTDITEEIIDDIDKFIEQVEQLRNLAGPVPFVDTDFISLPTQQYLRRCQESQWQTILSTVAKNHDRNSSEPGLWLSPTDLGQLDPAMQQATAQLVAYREQNSELAFSRLTARISIVRNNYHKVWQTLLAKPILKGSDTDQLKLLDLRDETWEETKKGILEASERILTQGIPPGLPPTIIKNTVKIQVSSFVPALTEPIVNDLLADVLEPNLTKDKKATEYRAKQAEEAVESVVVEIKQGEVIVDVGEKITQEQFVLLDGFALSRRGPNWGGLRLSAVIVTGAVGIFVLLAGKYHIRLRRRDHILLCLLSLSTPLLVIFQLPYSNLPAIGLLVSSFYSPTLAAGQVTLLTGLVTFSTGGQGWESLLAGAAGGILSAILAGRLRSREELAMVGAGVGLIQGSVYLIINLILSASAGTIWYAVLQDAAVYGLSGVAWIVVALGISPYLERLFDLITPIRLAELSNTNRPLLKRLAKEAPGTFQHTMFVATLAEAAARELHCNVELVRAGTLYHDIGKMHDPLGFIENQMGGPNKHDTINDPIKSTEIIQKHVTEGLVMARKYGLPKAISDFIPEHQGTLLISYFYFQAKQRAGEEGEEILESDFRYDGPIPQSRETGIVMLADGCEAALRSLKNATPEHALPMIHKIFQARWRENQLMDSGLKKEELRTIAKVFVDVWQQSNHKRIAYPKAALEPPQKDIRD